MNLNDQLQFHLIFDLTYFLLKFRCQRLPACWENKWGPRVDELQRYIGLNCGENLAVTDSYSILTSISDFSVSSRSPPSHSYSALQMQFCSVRLHNKKYFLGGKN